MSDVNGSLTDTYDYEAFGEVINQTGSTENSYLFTGEQFDAGLNQYYLRARYYNQQVGRFTQMDTWMGNNHDPITLHKYVYGNADPANYSDPTGMYSMTEMSATTNGIGTLSTVSVSRVALGFAANDAVFATGTLTSSQIGFATLRAMGVTALTSLLVKKDEREEDRERTIGLSRAVGDTELASMYTCLCFSLGPNAFPKQFFHTNAEALKFGHSFIFKVDKKPRFHLVQASISSWLYQILDHEVGEPGVGPIVTVPNELLSAFNLDMNKHGGFRYISTHENKSN